MSGSRCRKPEEKRQKGKKCGEIFPFKARDERQKCKINIKEQYLGNTGK